MDNLHRRFNRDLFASDFTREPRKYWFWAALGKVGSAVKAGGSMVAKGAAKGATTAAKGAATGAKAVGQTAYKGAKAAYKSDFVQKEIPGELKKRALSGVSRVETQATRSGIQPPVQENQQKVKLYGLQEGGNPLHYGSHMEGKKCTISKTKSVRKK